MLSRWAAWAIVLLPCSAIALQAARPARAQEARSTGRSLSLEDALAAGDERAARVRVARSVVRQAEARAVGSLVLLPVNPRVAADLRPPVSAGAWGDTGYSVTGEVYFDVGGAPGARHREALRGADSARASLAVARREMRAEVWTAYVRAKIAEMRVGEAEAFGELARRVLDAVRLRSELGASGDVEQSMAALELAQLLAGAEGARRERSARVMELRDALDLPAGEPLALTTALDAPPPPRTDAALLVARAIEARPELAEIRSHFALLDATDERLRREVDPRVGVYGGIDAAPLSPMFGVLGVSVELPVAQRNQGPRARVARERDTEALRLELAVRHVEREVLAARAEYQSRHAELAAIREQALPAAERTFELAETGWRAGRFDVFRVTSAERDVVRVRTQRLDALEGTWLQLVALDRAVGGDAP